MARRKPDLTALIYGKVPPQATELEEAVIGACMLEREAYDAAKEVIPSHECFYMDAHQKIWKAMEEICAAGSVVDLLTVTDQLQKNGDIELIGGAYYLTNLTMTVTSSAHVATHARIVMEKFMLREAIRICGETISEAYSGETDVFEMLDNLESSTKAITASIASFEETQIGMSVDKVVERYAIQKKTQSNLIGLDTGIVALNEITGGLRTPGLIMIAAYPSEGKTALMLELSRKIESLNKMGRGKIYSLETGDISLASRMVASENHISFEALQKGTLNPAEEDLLYRSVANFHKKRISISTKVFNIEDICKSARKLKKKHPDLGAIYLDFIQLVRTRVKMDKAERVGYVSRELKLLSAELEVPIIALSQMNREGKKNNASKKPQLENLAWSSELEQNADLVIFIWYKESESGGQPEPHLVIAKNKDGKTGEIRVRFDAEYQNWDDFDNFNTGKLPSFVEGQYQKARIPYKDSDDIF